ncbi:MAG TPA: flotillin-like FloA family protein, partial [Longimicrobiaceae bacterium]|nr:flotillin-like FloA family protein [Longimicrobiaceae bacterium]
MDGSPGGTELLILVLVLVVAPLTAGFRFLRFVPLVPWWRTRASGVQVPFLNLFGMRFRGVDPARIVEPLVAGHAAGIALRSDDLEGHHLAGGDVERVVQALIAARRAGLDLSFIRAAAIDLGGGDVLGLVQASTGRDDFRRRMSLFLQERTSR